MTVQGFDVLTKKRYRLKTSFSLTAAIPERIAAVIIPKPNEDEIEEEKN